MCPCSITTEQSDLFKSDNDMIMIIHLHQVQDIKGRRAPGLKKKKLLLALKSSLRAVFTDRPVISCEVHY